MTVRSITNFHVSLDLDSTLIHSFVDQKSLIDLKIYTDPAMVHLQDRIYRFDLVDVTTPEGTGVVTTIWGSLRPFLRKFIVFCNAYFVGIHVWSAGQYKYVHSINEVIFPRGTIQPSTVLTFEDCVFTPTTILKPLSKLYEMPSATGANPTNTLAIDDREDTFAANPGNGIQIPVYEPQPTIDGIMSDDIALQQLMEWLSLDKVKLCKDVRTLDKSDIFTTDLATYKSLARKDKMGASEIPKSKDVAADKRSSFFPSIYTPHD